MKNLLMMVLLFISLSVSAFSFAQEGACPNIVEGAIDSLAQYCEGTGRDQVCYGHNAVTAAAQPDASDFSFESVGDITQLAAVASMRLTPMDTSVGHWGVVLMRAQANIPDTVPGQNVTFILFGDTEIRNAAQSVAEQEPTILTAFTNVAANVRVSPGTGSPILTSLPINTQVTVNGRNPANDWLRILLPDNSEQEGWISRSLLNVDGDANLLYAVQPGQPQYGPMQAFSLHTGVGAPQCDDAPIDGMLIQTPAGVGEISLVINEVVVEFGSTIFLTAHEGSEMTIAPVEGKARVSADGSTRTTVAGAQITIPLNDDLTPAAEPNLPTAYDETEFGGLPLSLLERSIEIEDALSEDNVARLVKHQDLFAAVEFEDIDDVYEFLENEPLEFGDSDDDLQAIARFLQDDLGYDDFDDELESYFEDELESEIELESESSGDESRGSEVEPTEMPEPTERPEPTEVPEPTEPPESGD